MTGCGTTFRPGDEVMLRPDRWPQWLEIGVLRVVEVVRFGERAYVVTVRTEASSGAWRTYYRSSELVAPAPLDLPEWLTAC